jgi:hypothetical protein
MNTLNTNRLQIIEIIKALPEDDLSELINFVDYLRYRSIAKQSLNPSGNFLLSVAKLGTSMEQNISEQDEEILTSEIDPIYGWSLHSGK